MVRTQHEIVSQVYQAKADPEAADGLIRQYMGFIRSEVLKSAAPTHGGPPEDELSIAMAAFYEAILGYERGRGAFLSYAARAIRNRLVDHYRRESRHSGQLSLNVPREEEGSEELLDSIPDSRDEIEARDLQEASRKEIAEFGRQLAAMGISFSDVAESCPRQSRTLAACHRVLAHARANPHLLERFVRSGRLPVSELALSSGTDRKTMERHRNYLAAILLAFTNGYEIIREHLRQMTSGEKGGRM